ncbi:MAG: TIGR02757 family protein [Candidatus Hydrogenedentota bacterium]
MINSRRLHTALEHAYRRYNRPEFVDPDPLAPVLRYTGPLDQEVAGLVSMSLAFGNVKTILASTAAVLAHLPRPHADLLAMDPAELHGRLRHFRHRYVTGADMANLLTGAQRLIKAEGSLGAAFRKGLTPDAENILPALTFWVWRLYDEMGGEKNYLLPDPTRGSACKRLLMYLRWMVRKDAVDPGPWAGIPPRLLVVPMDTHMHRMATALGFTRRKTADLRTAIEVTGVFARFAPEDPVRYDFALTRFGIRRDNGLAAFLEEARG